MTFAELSPRWLVYTLLACIIVGFALTTPWSEESDFSKKRAEEPYSICSEVVSIDASGVVETRPCDD